MDYYRCDYMLPKECFSCGTPINQEKVAKFHYKTIHKERTPSIVLDKFNILKPCCRRMFLGDPFETRKLQEQYQLEFERYNM